MSKTKLGGARKPEFNDDQVLEIRRLAAKGISTAEIARDLGKRYDTVSRVVLGKSYKRLLGLVISTPLGGARLPVGFDVGTRLVDCDPRRQREGTISALTKDAAEVRWSTGKTTFVARSKVHNRRGSKKGFLVIGRGLSAPAPSETVTQAAA